MGKDIQIILRLDNQAPPRPNKPRGRQRAVLRQRERRRGARKVGDAREHETPFHDGGPGTHKVSWCCCCCWEGKGGKYQKCTVLTPTGLFHALWNHDSWGALPLVPPAPPVPVPASELCQRRPAERRMAGVKNCERKAGREARKRVDDGVAIVVCVWWLVVVTLFFVESVREAIRRWSWRR